MAVNGRMSGQSKDLFTELRGGGFRWEGFGEGGFIYVLPPRKKITYHFEAKNQ